MTQAPDPKRPNFSNLVDMLHHSVERHHSRPLFGEVDSGQVRWTSFAEFQALVERFRTGLAGLGVKRGDKVAVIANNRLEWAVGSHACYSLGAAYVPMYEAQHDKEWQYILRDSGAVVCLVARQPIEARVKAMQPSLPDLQHVVSFEADGSTPTSYAALLARDPQVPPIVPEGDEPATLIYTSGTTGTPKGVILTHHNLSSNVNALLEIVDVGSDDRGVSFLPWAHVFGGCVELNLAIATGSSTAICGDPTKLTEYLPLVQPTVLFAVPRVWNKIHAGVLGKMAAAPAPVQRVFHTALNARKKQYRGERLALLEHAAAWLAERTLFPKIRAGLGGRLRFAVSGAAALSREVAEFMMALGVEVHEGYGLTETGGGGTAQPPQAIRLGSVGRPVPGVRLELDKTVASAREDEGELIIYGPNVMRGYHNRDEDTRQSLTVDGGLRTGDLARIDEDGYVYITGRVKELYKLENGKYVAPVPIEERLERSPYIAQAIVTGQDKPHNVALIIPDMQALRQWAERYEVTAQSDDALLSDPQVRGLFESEVGRCNAEGKGYERIASFLLDSEELTPHNGLLTMTLKPKRRAIMAKYGAALDVLYTQVEPNASAPRSSYIRELRGADKPAAKSA